MVVFLSRFPQLILPLRRLRIFSIRMTQRTYGQYVWNPKESKVLKQCMMIMHLTMFLFQRVIIIKLLMRHWVQKEGKEDIQQRENQEQKGYPIEVDQLEKLNNFICRI